MCQGTTFSYNGSAVGGLVSIKGVASGTVNANDVSTLASTAKEFSPGLLDNGDFEIELRRNQDDVGQAAIYTGLGAQVLHTGIITLPTSTANVATFQCFPINLTTEVKADGAVMGSAKFKISGTIVWS